MIRPRRRQTLTPITIIDAIDDLFGPWFRRRETWAAWFAFLKALFALPMDATELTVSRMYKPRSASRASHRGMVGLRQASRQVLHLGLGRGVLRHLPRPIPLLVPGERATIVVIAADRKQARIILRYIKALLSQVPMLAAMIARETRKASTNNRVTVEVHTASFRKSRGYAIPAALLDELAFWPTDDAAEPDHEIIAALKPGMATIPGAMLFCSTSPYSSGHGALWTAFDKHFGKDGPVLVWRAPTRTMNPTVSQSIIDDAYEADPSSAAAEYGAEFRSDLEAFVSREIIDACTTRASTNAPRSTTFQYTAFFDGAVVRVRTVRSLSLGTAKATWPLSMRSGRPDLHFRHRSLFAATPSFAQHYGVEKYGGPWGGEWPRELFREQGISYECAEKSASDLYVEALPLLNSHRVRLLDHPLLHHN